MTSLNILITGSNAGFGRLMVETLAKDGHVVFAGMRDSKGKNEGAATEIKAWASKNNAKVHVVDIDVTSDASVNSGVESALKTAGGKLDVAINNAGIACFGHGEGFTSAQVSQLFDVNVVGPQRVNRAVLPSMRKANSGLIVQISSGLARLPLVFMGPYCATKAAVDSLTETTRYELAATGVDAVIVQPGAFPTGLGQKSMSPADKTVAAGYGAAANGPEMMGKQMESMFAGPNAPSPQMVADAVLKLVNTPKGQRPLRTVVDAFTAPVVEGINKATAEIVTQAYVGMGMGMMVGKA